MFFDNLTKEQQELFLEQLRKYYPKREVDLHSLFIKIVEINSLTTYSLERLRGLTGNKDAFLFIGYTDCELYIERKTINENYS